MQHGHLLQDLAVVMLVAGLVTILFHRMRQPVVLGYILAGVIIGPHTPPFQLVSDFETIKTLAELGIIFLMFSLGLEFNLKKLQAVGSTAFLAAVLEIALMIWVGYEIGRWFGWSAMDSIFLGSILAISSSTIILKALEGMGKSKEKWAEYVFGILIVEDMLAIVLLAVLSGVADQGTLDITDFLLTVGKLGTFLVVILVAGLIVVPRLLNYVSRFRNEEVVLITVLGLCFGVCLLASWLDYSVALGAFLIGAVIAEARQIHRIEELLRPVRDMFSAVFFVAIGLLIDPAVLLEHAWAVAVITVAVVAGKIITCTAGPFLAGHGPRTSMRIGFSMAQIGEFSFIIAALGQQKGVTSEFLYPIAVAVSSITTLLTPYLIKGSDPAVAFVGQHAPGWLSNWTRNYTRWASSIANSEHENILAKTVRRLALQMTLNMFLIAGIFIGMALAILWGHPLLEPLGLSQNLTHGLAWLLAVFIALPVYVATFRKLEATAILLGELAEGFVPGGGFVINRFVSNLTMTAGSVLLIFVTLGASAAILPSWHLALIGVLLVVAASILLRRQLIRVYASAQLALKETLEQPKDAHAHALGSPHDVAHAPTALTPIPITIHAEAPAVGQTVRGLNLRARTGASILSIERDDRSIVNPGPDEILKAGDRLLVMAEEAQLREVRKILGLAR